MQKQLSRSTKSCVRSLLLSEAKTSAAIVFAFQKTFLSFTRCSKMSWNAVSSVYLHLFDWSKPRKISDCGKRPSWESNDRPHTWYECRRFTAPHARSRGCRSPATHRCSLYILLHGLNRTYVFLSKSSIHCKHVWSIFYTVIKVNVPCSSASAVLAPCGTKAALRHFWWDLRGYNDGPHSPRLKVFTEGVNFRGGWKMCH